MNIETIKKIAKKAGEEILKFYKTGLEVSYKIFNAPLTKADLVSQKIILDGLRKYGHPILSEESEDDKKRLKSKRVWIVDPLDGTSDFINRITEFCVMISLVESGRPILSLIYRPIGDIYYFSERGKGAFKQTKNEIKKIGVSDKRLFRKTKILLSRNHIGEKEQIIAKNLAIGEVVRFGSAGLKLCSIAEGKGEIYINSSDRTWEWDTAAGSLILEEAGGKLTDMFGEKITYNQSDPRHLNGYVATNSIVHKEVIAALKKI